LMASEHRANEQSRLLGALNSASASLASEHNVAKIVQDVVDYGVKITGAEFGAFFFVMDDDGSPRLHLEALSGIPRDHFPEGDVLRATDMFVTNLADVIIVDDVSQHDKFGKNEPHLGFPEHHPRVKSYIGIPIISNSGVQIGALLLGHRDEGRFTTMHEQSVRGLAGMTSIVIENAHLYSAAQAELEERKRYEAELVAAAERQNLLLRELNHRVKNTLVTVQSIAMQTKNAAISKLGLNAHPDRLINLHRFYAAFESRLLALSGTHDLLVNGAWADVLLRDSVVAAIQPLIDMDRITVRGPNIKLAPNAAVTLNMVFHELSTNAIKYGAASNETGRITVEWEVIDKMLRILWTERGGPIVDEPDGVGFGSKLLDRAISREMRGRSEMMYLPDGIECFMQIPLSANIRHED
jgi:two-component sensor histidine kinase